MLDALGALPIAPPATRGEALAFLARHALAGHGLGWIDVHLLASTALAADARLWTRDRRLALVAGELRCAYSEDAH